MGKISRLIAAALLSAGLVACAALTGPAGSSSAVSLASAQAQAQAILTGLQQAAVVYESSPQASPAVVKEMNADIAAATSAVDAFKAVSPGANAAQIAQSATQAIAAVLTVMPIDPATKAAIDLGLAVVDAFVGGISPPPGVPAAAPSSAPATARGFVEPPVPIPAPRRLLR